MLTRNPLSENALSSLYEKPDFLPPLWRIIYQEAVRGNHVLFENVPEARYASRTITIGRPGVSKSISKDLSKTVTKIFKSSSITEMKQIINKLNRQEKDVLFLMYERAIVSWKKQLKASLN